MNFKRKLGCMLLTLTSVLVDTGNVSFALVGVEEMPKSMKENR